MTEFRVEEGFYDLIPYAKRWSVPGTFPRRYWDLTPVDEWLYLDCAKCGDEFRLRRSTHERYRGRIRYCYDCYMVWRLQKKSC